MNEFEKTLESMSDRSDWVEENWQTISKALKIASEMQWSTALEVSIDELNEKTTEAVEMNIEDGAPNHNVSISAASALCILAHLLPPAPEGE